MLDFSRIESGRVLAAYVATDLAVYTADLASIFRAAVEKAGLTLNIDCPGLPEPVYVDREMWEKVVLNLLSNAFKHTFEGGIDVKLRWREGCVELTVADTGVGIRPEELPRLFERFHQIKEAKSRTHEGTGIGLALVRQLVQLHGGTITVESREGKGSIFKVALKTGRDHLPADQVKAASTPSSTAPRAAAYAEEAIRWLPELMTADVEPEASARRDFSKKRIVVADDNADMREYLRKLLAGRYEVVVTANGKEALAAIRGRRPDLILSDIMMPVMDGLELLKELRADLELRTLPVIFLSARAGEEAKIGWIGLGVDDYIVKPFSVKELLARVQTQLNLSEIRENAIKQVAFANAELETFNYSVAHDLRAPLRSIDGFSKLLLDKYAEKIDEEGRDFLRRVRAGASRMGELIDDLLRLANVTRGVLRREIVDLSALARQVAEGLQNAAADRAVEFIIAPDLKAEGDGVLLQLVLENLLGNAWKYTSKHQSARIEFGATRAEGRPVYFVRDDGAGFDIVFANKLFKPFSRLHTLREFEGSGIGLATVSRIIARHGGRIWGEGQVEKGAAFYFTLGEGPHE